MGSRGGVTWQVAEAEEAKEKGEGNTVPAILKRLRAGGESPAGESRVARGEPRLEPGASAEREHRPFPCAFFFGGGGWFLKDELEDPRLELPILLLTQDKRKFGGRGTEKTAGIGDLFFFFNIRLFRLQGSGVVS